MTTPEQRAELLALADERNDDKIYMDKNGDIFGENITGPYDGIGGFSDDEWKYIVVAYNLAPELAVEVGELRNAIADLIYYVLRRNFLATEVVEMTEKIKRLARNAGMADLIPKDF